MCVIPSGYILSLKHKIEMVTKKAEAMQKRLSVTGNTATTYVTKKPAQTGLAGLQKKKLRLCPTW